MKRYINDILTKILTLTLLLFAGANVAWGQDYSGVYYIGTAGYNPSTPADNFYLCPTEGWIYYKPTDSWDENGTTYPNPFLTTYKCKTNDYHSGDASTAVWVIKQASDPNTGYYYIIHAKTGQYMVSNGKISGTSNANRMRVHLETVAETNLDDKELFSITPYPENNPTYLVISPKSEDGWNKNQKINNVVQDLKWYTVNGGNKNYTYGYDSNGGPAGYVATGGILGLYTQSDANAKFYLEKYSPSITFNESNQIEISAVPSDATLVYTTDGSDPTSSHGTTASANTVSFDPNDDVTTIKAIAIVNGKESDVATFTPPTLIGPTHKRLIQSQYNAWNTTDFNFYMIPGDEGNENGNVNTTSLFRPTMEWYFEYAGKESGNLYYNIVNGSTGQYLYYDADNVEGKRIWVKAESAYSSSDNGYKFSIQQYPTTGAVTGYNIIPYGLTSGNRFVNKGNNNNNTPITLSNSSSNANSLWKFIKKADVDMTTPPFVVFEGTNTKYYKIQNAGNADYYVIPPANSGNASVSNSTNEDVVRTMHWCFVDPVEPTASDWLTYYRIRNAVTGDYLFFTKEDNNAGAAFEMRSTIEVGNEDRYLFTWAKTPTENTYYIVPKLLKDKTLNDISTLQRNNSVLQTNLTRGAGAYAWKFVEDETFVVAPVIEVSNDNSSATPSSPQNGVELYYTIGAYDDNEMEPADPWDEGNNTAATGAILFTPGSSSPIALTEGKRNVIKVIAVKTVGENKYISTLTKNVVDRRTDDSPDYSGYYYIQNNKDQTYYLYPTNANEGSTLKTDTKQDLAAVWQLVKQQGTGAHNIIHYSDGKYLTTVDPIQSTNTVKLMTKGVSETGTEVKYLFVVEKDATDDFFVIKPINANQAESKNYLNPIGGKGKTIGLWSASDQASQWLLQTPPAKPTFSVSDINVTITPPFGDVFYKVDNLDYDGDDATDPTATSGTKGTNVTLNYGPTYKVKAVSAYKFDGTNYLISDEVAEQDVQVNLTNPTISSFGTTVNITSTQDGVSFKYSYATTDNTDPKTSGTDGNTFTLTSGSRYFVKAIAYNVVDGTTYWSDVTTIVVNLMNAETIHTLADITDAGGNYILADNFKISGTARVGGTETGEIIGTSTNPFTGEIDGQMHTITTKATVPLFDYIQDATIKNVIIEEVGISVESNVGAICGEASGATRIYNCGVLKGSVISSNGAAGGLVGHIASGSKVRVVNCYNYATISGSTYAAGIVGCNEGTVGNVRIAMCMMYGNISSGATVISPVYAGNHVSNDKNYSEYNYWRSKASLPYTAYNDQLAITNDEYLTRWPFYRHILNTHRELAAFFLYDNYGNVSEIGHWVLKKGTNAPQYPVLENWETNTHKTTVDIKNNLPSTTADNEGKLLTNMGSNGYLTVNVYVGNTLVGSPTLPITDMDINHYDYTYGKVVLPFANEFSGWDRDWSKVCTGWEITDVGGETSSAVPHYNFADRDDKKKDIYDATNNPYIFAQGGNYIVPYGVTSISIKAHFANAFYLSDPQYERAYDAAVSNPVNLGGAVPSTYHGKTVYTDLSTLVSQLASATNPHDQAIVLVGNFHYVVKDKNTVLFNTGKAVTIMSADEDNNQEPDYGWYSSNNYGRLDVPPLRFDFLPNIEIGMASRVKNTTNGSTYYPGIGLWNTRGWFELTETSVSNMIQCEIESKNFSVGDNGKGNNRWIANSGCFDQIIRSKAGACTNLSYIQIGGNAYVKEFYPGSHSDKGSVNTAVPIIVTGGQIDECYMTGSTAIGKDNNPGQLKGDMIYFWCAGGKIKKFLGAYMEEPVSNFDDNPIGLTAKIDHAIIGRFFGGGTSVAARIKGDIDITINNSTVDFYCGGPEFGDMYEGKTVRTQANGTTFGEYYGAGFGGTSITYKRELQDDGVSIAADKLYPLDFSNYKRLIFETNMGFGTCYKFDYIFHSSGTKAVARFYTGYAQFSLATTGNVTNILNNCIIKKLPGTNSLVVKESSGDFYGAGCQGMVDGTVTSTLTGCTLEGSAFGGGYKATSNNVDVYTTTPPSYATYYHETGIFGEFGTVAPVVFTWEQGTESGETKENTYVDCDQDGNGGKLYTSKDVKMANLGNVSGAISLTIDGGSVAKNVFGGGNESKSLLTASVTIKDSKIGTSGNTATGNVYGGGNEAEVSGNTTVTLAGNAEVYGDVFGGGNNGEVGGSATVNIKQAIE